MDFDYEYNGKGCPLIDGYSHRAFVVTLGDKHVANGVDVTYPDGAIEIRIFDYDPPLKDALYAFFKRAGVRDVTFSRPFEQ